MRIPNLAKRCWVPRPGRREAPAGRVQFQISAPENARLDPLFSVSPDGRKLAFLSGGRLWVHSLESGESRDLAGADGTPFWSPDSRFIGFPHQGKLKKIESTGGPSQTVTDYRSLWGAAAWNRDDVIVFSEQRSGFFRVPASGGVPVPLTTVDSAREETVHWGPSFLPDGRHFLYTRWFRDAGKSAIYVGSTD